MQKPQVHRYLNACPACALQYDVSHQTPGARIRCRCGVRFAARHSQPHSPRILRCSNCGGNLEENARSCGYCSAEVTLDERRLTEICPGCFARMVQGAHFCMECGIGIQPQALAALTESAPCPRCKADLRGREVEGASLIECNHCGGLWLTPEGFESICERTQKDATAPNWVATRSVPIAPLDNHPPAYLACPTCSEFMNRRNYGSSSGVIVDICKDHGVWLDHRELERVVDFIQGGGHDRQRRRDIQRLEMERNRLRADTASDRHSVLTEPLFERRSMRRGGGVHVFAALAELVASIFVR